MKIGIFDSGIGGLSVANSVFLQYPHTDLCYVADSKYLPYGTQPEYIIKKRVQKIVEFLIGEGCNHIICACNTAFALAESVLKDFSNHHSVFNVTEKFITSYASKLPKNVALIATRNTIDSQIYPILLEKYGHDFQLHCISDESLVVLLENEAPQNEVEHAISLLCGQVPSEAEGIILGCTHYNDQSNLFQKFLPEVNIFSSEKAFNNCFDDHQSQRTSLTFYDTGTSPALRNKVKTLFHRTITSVDLALQD